MCYECLLTVLFSFSFTESTYFQKYLGCQFSSQPFNKLVSYISNTVKITVRIPFWDSLSKTLYFIKSAHIEVHVCAVNFVGF